MLWWTDPRILLHTSTVSMKNMWCEFQNITYKWIFGIESIYALKIARLFTKRNSEVIVLVWLWPLALVSLHQNHSVTLIINDLEKCCFKYDPQINCVTFTWMCLLKLIECTAPRANLNVYYGLQLIIMDQCWFIDCNIWATLMWYVDSGEHCVHGGGDLWELCTFCLILLLTWNFSKKNKIKFVN